MHSIVRVNLRVLPSLTLLVLWQINPLHYNFLEKQGVNERLCIKEGGVYLELCVHAHGPNVDLIMEASCDNNNPLVISSSSNLCLVFCNRGSDHDCSPLDPFLGQVKALVFCRSMHLCNLYF